MTNKKGADAAKLSAENGVLLSTPLYWMYETGLASLGPLAV